MERNGEKKLSITHKEGDMMEKKKVLVMISIASQKTGMHPQTLRMYENRGLIQPKRTNGNTRLYSEEDIQRLLLIQELSAEGVTLKGIERILDLREAAFHLKKSCLEQNKVLKQQEQEIYQLRAVIADLTEQIDQIGDQRRKRI